VFLSAYARILSICLPLLRAQFLDVNNIGIACRTRSCDILIARGYLCVWLSHQMCWFASVRAISVSSRVSSSPVYTIDHADILSSSTRDPTLWLTKTAGLSLSLPSDESVTFGQGSRTRLDLARNVQRNKPPSHLRVFLTDRRAYCHVLPCGMRKAPWIFHKMDRRFISGAVQSHTRPSQGRSFIQYGARGWLPSIASNSRSTEQPHASVLVLSGVRRSPWPDLPDYRQLVPNLQSPYCNE
jgi:hypothetical protein